MYGYTFEVTNNKTGDTYIGKVYAVSFNKHYFGEESNEELAKAIAKYGKTSFSVKMLMPYDSAEAVDWAFNEIKKPVVKKKKAEPRTKEDEVLEVTTIENVEHKEEKKPKTSSKKRSTKKD